MNELLNLTRRCGVCGEVKKMTEFYCRKDRGVNGYWNTRCKVCHIAITKKQQIKYRKSEGYKEYVSKIRREKFKDRNSRYYLSKRWHAIKARAVRSGIDFQLTREDIKEIINSSCCYCGFKANEVDRKNPQYGYVLNNIVPSCHECNVAKSNFWTFEEMKKIGKAIKMIRFDRERYKN